TRAPTFMSAVPNVNFVGGETNEMPFSIVGFSSPVHDLLYSPPVVFGHSTCHLICVASAPVPMFSVEVPDSVAFQWSCSAFPATTLTPSPSDSTESFELS